MTRQLTPSAKLPILVEGDDYTFAVSFTDRSGAAIDITGWTVSMTIADQQSNGGTPIVERDITTHDDATGGKTSWDLPGSETAGTTGTKRYDIQVVKSDGTTRTVALGTVGFLDGATDRAISGSGGGAGANASAGAAIDVTLDGDDSISLSIQGLTNYTDADVLDAINGAAISPGELHTKTQSSNYHYAAEYDGGDADARLTNAIVAASNGDTIHLEKKKYTTPRTIEENLNFVSPKGGAVGAKAVWEANWDINAQGVEVTGGRIEDSGCLTINADYCLVEKGTHGGGRSSPHIQVNSGKFRCLSIAFGNVVFGSGTSGGVIDSCVKTTVTDNGNNTIGDIA